jgi:hypothetical protein
MAEQPETAERRQTRYLRYAAEARELAARTTDSVREHHVRVALAWEAMARKLAPHLTEPKAKLLQSVDDAIPGGSDAAADRVRLALGRRTEAVRGRLADRFIGGRYRHGAVTPEGDDRPHGADDPSS